LKSPVSSPIFLILALTGLASADLPKKAPLSRYAGLWTNSPFTSKPPPPELGPESNPLDDYALIGVSPIGGTGYRVTLINKKKTDERITVDSGSTKTDFKILEVVRKSGDPLGTVVRMSSGSLTGTVSFDEKLLTLVAAPAAKTAPPVPGQQPGQPNQVVVPQSLPSNGQPGAPSGLPNQRQPRPRVIPPPPTGTTAQPVQVQRPERRGN
jgi:hypothetical protein